MYEYDTNFVFTNTTIPRKLLILDNQNYNKIELLTNNPNNIEKLQNTINEKQFFCAVKSIGNRLNKKCKSYREKYIYYYKNKEYIETQGGLFITNLKYWRKNKIYLKILEVIKDQYKELLGKGGDELVAIWVWEQAQKAWIHG